MKKEIFKPIPGFPNYLVSNKARIKSIAGPLHKILKPSQDNDRYRLRHNGRQYHFGIEAIMIEADFD